MIVKCHHVCGYEWVSSASRFVSKSFLKYHYNNDYYWQKSTGFLHFPWVEHRYRLLSKNPESFRSTLSQPVRLRPETDITKLSGSAVLRCPSTADPLHWNKSPICPSRSIGRTPHEIFSTSWRLVWTCLCKWGTLTLPTSRNLSHDLQGESLEGGRVLRVHLCKWWKSGRCSWGLRGLIPHKTFQDMQDQTPQAPAAPAQGGMTSSSLIVLSPTIKQRDIHCCKAAQFINNLSPQLHWGHDKKYYLLSTCCSPLYHHKNFHASTKATKGNEKQYPFLP